MKKIIATLLALMLALMSLTALAEDAVSSPDAGDLPEYVLLNGFVYGVEDGYYLIRTPDGLYVEAHLTEETLLEGQEVTIGDYIYVVYNGMMTRSLPAQITALTVMNHSLTGFVSEMAEDGFVLTVPGEDGGMDYVVNALPSQLAGIQDGMDVTVYFDGTMTMSLPAQIGAGHIRGQIVTGTVTEMVEGGFTMTVEGDETIWHVALKEDANLFVQPEPGLTLRIVTDGLMTASLYEVLVNATEVLPMPAVQELYTLSGIVTEIAPEYVLFTTADGQTIQANLFDETVLEGKEIAAGDFIHVTFNGQMTFSIPAQIAALKIGCYALEGEISDLSEDQLVLNTEMEPVIVTVTPEMAAALADGMNVTVYFNGVMTMSLPARINADLVTVIAE